MTNANTDTSRRPHSGAAGVTITNPFTGEPPWPRNAEGHEETISRNWTNTPRTSLMYRTVHEWLASIAGEALAWHEPVPTPLGELGTEDLKEVARRMMAKYSDLGELSCRAAAYAVAFSIMYAIGASQHAQPFLAGLGFDTDVRSDTLAIITQYGLTLVAARAFRAHTQTNHQGAYALAFEEAKPFAQRALDDIMQRLEACRASHAATA